MATSLRVFRLLPFLALVLLSSWPSSRTARASTTGQVPSTQSSKDDAASHVALAADEPSLEDAAPPAPTAAAPEPPSKLRRLLKKEVRPGVAREARRIIGTSHDEPIGTEIPFVVDDREYVARIEEHYHPPGGEARPWGKHAGVSVFVDWPVAAR